MQALASLDDSAASDFGNSAVAAITKGPNKRQYASAAQALGVDVEVVEGIVEGLSHFFQENVVQERNEAEFSEILLALGFSDQKRQTLWEIFRANSEIISAVVENLKLSGPSFADLEWRLDVQIGSRTVRQELQPSYKLRLHLTPPPNVATPPPVVMTSEVSVLQHVSKELKNALNEAQSYHSRRMQRFIK